MQTLSVKTEVEVGNLKTSTQTKDMTTAMLLFNAFSLSKRLLDATGHV